MSAIELARAERAELCDLFEEVGPDEPTLCEGWSTRDLAAHLVIREGRPDAALGILGGPLAAWTEKVQNDAASQDYEKLVRLVRTGPPIWSYFRLPWVDGQLNTIEYYVHHEDVRRRSRRGLVRARTGPGTAGLPVGPLDPRLPVGCHEAGRPWLVRWDQGWRHPGALRRPGGRDSEHKAKSGDPMVTVSGTPGELIMVAFGRSEADVEVSGDPDAVDEFLQTRLHIDLDDLLPPEE